MGLLDSLLGNPILQQAGAAIESGMKTRRETTLKEVTALCYEVFRYAQEHPSSNEADARAYVQRYLSDQIACRPPVVPGLETRLDRVLEAASHAPIIRDMAAKTGVAALRTLADRMDGKKSST